MATALPDADTADAPADARHHKPPIHQDVHDLPQRRPVLRRAKWAVAILLMSLVAGAVVSMVLRSAQARNLESSTAAHAAVHVSVVTASRMTARQPLLLPGTLQGTIESPIYARSTGYLKRWTKDIGSHVKKGDVLATLDTPEIDQELSQALAARRQTAASLELAKSSAARWESLRQKDAVTQQELDERRSTYAQAQANLASADANVRRLQQLEAFKNIVAPFAGVVTRRNVDVGDLIDAGSGAGRALFTVAQIDPLRIYLYVPQSDAQRIRVGADVQVLQAEMPDQVFHGKLARTAGAIDTATRTLQVEISLPNSDGKLLSGSYVQVALPVGDPGNALLVPSNVLLFRPKGTEVAVVDGNGSVRLHPVTLGRDYGSSIEIVAGIAATDKIVLNPPDSIVDNDRVTVAAPASAPASGPEQ